MRRKFQILLDSILEFVGFRQSVSGQMPRALFSQLLISKSSIFKKGIKGDKNDQSLLDKWSSQVKAYCSRNIGATKSKVAQFLSEIKVITLKLSQSFEDVVIQIATELRPARDNVIMAIVNRYDHLDKILRTKNDERLNAFVHLNAITEMHGGFVPSKKTIWDFMISMVILALFISGMEAAFSFEAVDALGIPWTPLSILICFAFGILVAVSCHFFGEAMANRDYLFAILSASCAFAVTLFVIYLRSHAPDLDGEIQHGLLAMANFVTLGVGLLLSVRVNKYRPYFDALDTTIELSSEVDELNKAVGLRDLEIENTKAAYIALAHQRAHQRIEGLHAEIAPLEIALATEQAHLNNQLQVMQNWENEGIAALNNSFSDGKNQRNIV